MTDQSKELENSLEKALPLMSPASPSFHRTLPDGVLEADWGKVSKSIVDGLKTCVAAGKWPAYICGDAGRGKTFAMASAFMRFQASAMWIDFQPWLRKLMAARVVGDSAEFIEMDRVKRTNLLCIDDCGIRTDSEAQQSAFLEVLNLRSGLPTIITGNHKPETLHGVFDSRIASRILSGTIFRMIGPDRRMAKSRIVEVVSK